MHPNLKGGRKPNAIASMAVSWQACAVVVLVIFFHLVISSAVNLVECSITSSWNCITSLAAGRLTLCCTPLGGKAMFGLCLCKMSTHSMTCCNLVMVSTLPPKEALHTSTFLMWVMCLVMVLDTTPLATKKATKGAVLCGSSITLVESSEEGRAMTCMQGVVESVSG